ncbi:MAG TPA: hypothetical protein VEZ17_05155 [Chitinophagaceae bacterium]|jgi:hypothetical protein|nr:hypothetical protein [Chitinophagaceae bacterium]
MTQNETSVAKKRPAGKTVPSSSGNRTGRKVVPAKGMRRENDINKDPDFILEKRRPLKKLDFTLSASLVPGGSEGSPKPNPGPINPEPAETSQVPSTTPPPEPTAPSTN